MARGPEDRSAMAVAMVWVNRVTTISLEMALPGLAGYWLDGRLGTRLVFTVAGVLLGMALGGWHLAAIAREGTTDQSKANQAGRSGDRDGDG